MVFGMRSRKGEHVEDELSDFVSVQAFRLWLSQLEFFG